MTKKFDFSRPRPAFLIYSQTWHDDAQEWTKSVVCFVLDTSDEDVKEEALTQEALSHKDWKLIDSKTDERLLLFNGANNYKKIFAIPTTIFDTK